MRPILLSVFVIVLAACGPTVTGGTGGSTTAGTGGASTSSTTGPACESAAAGVPECLWGACSADADCGQANYCEACASGGCAAGHCRPTRVQGVPCDRSEMCATGCCTDGRDVGVSGLACMPATYCGGAIDGGTCFRCDAGTP